MKYITHIHVLYVDNFLTFLHGVLLKFRSNLPMDTKCMQEGQVGRGKYRGWLHPFSSAPGMVKNRK
jgi:hypothetical protein